MSLDEPVCILSSGTAVPGSIFPLDEFKKLQREAAEFAISKLDPNDEIQKERIDLIKKNCQWVCRCADGSNIDKRHGIIPNEGDKLQDYYKKYDYNPPYNLRAKYWRDYCPKLAMKAVNECLKEWNGNPNLITHVVSHSTTGWDVPGLSHHIIYNLKLPESARAVPVNFVGCQGGTSIIYVGSMIAKQNPNSVVLCVAAEIQSPLGRMYNDNISLERSIYMPNVLFGDAAAACIIARPSKGISPTFTPYEILNQGAHYIPNTRHVLTISVSEESGLYYENSIKKELPVHLNSAMSKNFKKWFNSSLPKNVNPNDCAFAVHPGGKRLLDNFSKMIEDYGVKNSKNECKYSYYNLKTYGNLASAAIIFILGDVIKNTKKDWIYFMAMGPGVCLEYGGLKKYKKGNKAMKYNNNGNKDYSALLIIIIVVLIAFIISGNDINSIKDML